MKRCLADFLPGKDVWLIGWMLLKQASCFSILFLLLPTLDLCKAFVAVALARECLVCNFQEKFSTQHYFIPFFPHHPAVLIEEKNTPCWQQPCQKNLVLAIAFFFKMLLWLVLQWFDFFLSLPPSQFQSPRGIKKKSAGQDYVCMLVPACKLLPCSKNAHLWCATWVCMGQRSTF